MAHFSIPEIGALLDETVNHAARVILEREVGYAKRAVADAERRLSRARRALELRERELAILDERGGMPKRKRFRRSLRDLG